jgi:hypothetical protein
VVETAAHELGPFVGHDDHRRAEGDDRVTGHRFGQHVHRAELLR